MNKYKEIFSFLYLTVVLFSVSVCAHVWQCCGDASLYSIGHGILLGRMRPHNTTNKLNI